MGRLSHLLGFLTLARSSAARLLAHRGHFFGRRGHTLRGIGDLAHGVPNLAEETVESDRQTSDLVLAG